MKKQWYAISADKDNQSDVTIDMFGIIGGWDVRASSFGDDLAQYPNAKTITVRLNTLGGTFYDGLAIYNLLKQHSAVVTVRVMGYALSMGSIILLAADKREMSQNALLMIHRAQGINYGDANSMRKEADILEKHEKAILPDYQKALNLSEAEVLALLDAETWYYAEEAKAAGLIDHITDAIDLSQFDPKDEQASNQIKGKSLWSNLLGGAADSADHFDSDRYGAMLLSIKNTLDAKMSKENLAAKDKPAADKPAAKDKPTEKEPDAKEQAANFEALNVQLNAATTELERLSAELSAAKEEIAALSTPDKTTTDIPDNAGPAGQIQYGY